MLWQTEDGRSIHPSEMEDSHLVSVLRMLRRRAVKQWRDAFERGEEVASSWGHYLPPIWKDLLAEAARRRLQWEEVGHVDLTMRGKLESGIVGALRDSINAHGPITHESAPSAAKRVIGIIKVHNNNVKQTPESGR